MTTDFIRMDFPQGMELSPEYFEPLEIDVGTEHLTGVKAAKDLSKSADFIYFHGARGGNWSRIKVFAKPIVDQGSSIIAFDHSGHGTSTGEEKKASLEKRANEARTIIDLYANKNPITICGSSMGGHIAIKMLEYYDVQNLILLCPGVYDRRAYSVAFDSGFTEILREPESWKNSDITEILKSFKGNLLVLIGSEDTVIPKGVIELIDESAKNTKRKEIVTIPSAPHAIQEWMVANPEKAIELASKMAEFSLPPSQI